MMAVLATACGQVGTPAPVVYGGNARSAPPVQQASRTPGMDRTADGVPVLKDDTLYSVARRHKVALRDLIDANRLRSPYIIRPGQRLRLPSARLHDVQDGETLYGVARRYRVDIRSLVRLNSLRPPYRLTAGQRLRLPGKRREAAVASRGARAPASKPRRVFPRPAVTRRTPVSLPVALAHPPPRAGRKFLWPVRGRVSVGFGPRGKGLHNDGINILAPRGTVVRAAENGVVAYSGNQLRGFGNLLLIKHAGGWTSAYAHNQTVLVKAGQRVRKGQSISRVGRSGSVLHPQLHFELRRGRRAVDPLRYLSRRSTGALSPAVFPAARPGPG